MAVPVKKVQHLRGILRSFTEALKAIICFNVSYSESIVVGKLVTRLFRGSAPKRPEAAGTQYFDGNAANESLYEELV